MPQSWEQIKEIVAQALEQKAETREVFVRQACGQDQALRAEVESLLMHSQGADSILENSPLANVLSLQETDMAGKRVGAYRVIREIGRGGMAIVYLAERDDQHFRKRVAIKMVGSGGNTDEILRRFENERQTLAALDHPNIVKLLDGGSTEDGRPYLVMEYVDGVAIDKYCEVRQLAIPERLRLFQSVCGAMEYAHRNLVIHRDLKPDNVLITRDGVPRLLDFGIAKLLNPEYLRIPLVTRADWRPMTPEYASPEQLQGKPVTRATDVYSLGVLLYELLTGQLPYRGADKSLGEIEQLIFSQDPEKPSAAIARMGKKPSAVSTTTPSRTAERTSESRPPEPKKLRRQLQGDLDSIVLKALRKEPEWRYSSVAELSNDIERHLAGLPVKARGSTISYRGARFMHRHRESFIAVAISIAMVLAIGTGVAYWLERNGWRYGSTGQRTSGQTRARPSIAVMGFRNLSNRQDTQWISTALAEMLNTELAVGEQLRTVSGETVARAKTELALPDTDSLAPDTLARIRKNLASGYVVVGSYLDLGKEAGGGIRVNVRLQNTENGETVASVSESGTEAGLLDLVDQSGLRLRQRLGVGEISAAETQRIKASTPSNSEATRLYAEGLAKLRNSDALAARDLLTQAVAADPEFPLAHSALGSAWSTLGYDSNALAEAKKALDLGGQLRREDYLLIEARYYEASRQWSEAVETYRTLFRFFPDNVEYGLQLANSLSSAGKGKDALDALSALQAANAQAKDDPRLDLAASVAASSLGDNKLRCDAAQRAALKAEHEGAKLLLARARISQCRAMANLGENEAAKPFCEEARQIFAAANDRAGLARALHNLAEIPLNQGDFTTAGNLYTQALAIMREIGDKRDMGSELGNLGLVHAKQGDFSGAQQMYAEALESYREAGDKNGMVVATGNMGNLLQSEGKFSEALAAYRNTLALSNELGHKGSAALSMAAIGDVLAKQGDLAGASRMYQQAMTIERQAGEKGYYAVAVVSMGQVLREQAQFDKALNSYRESLSIQEEIGEKGDAAETRLAMAELACDTGRAAEGEQLANTALQEFVQEKQINKEIAAQILLARSLLQQGKRADGQIAMDQTLALSKGNQNVSIRLSLKIGQAHLLFANNDFLVAEKMAREALTEAHALGFLPMELEATLVLDEIQARRANRSVARQQLAMFARTASARGFKRIARNAAANRGE
jgi:eukaryotic-like serine/threonine-protein kinase